MRTHVAVLLAICAGIVAWLLLAAQQSPDISEEEGVPAARPNASSPGEPPLLGRREQPPRGRTPDVVADNGHIEGSQTQILGVILDADSRAGVGGALIRCMRRVDRGDSVEIARTLSRDGGTFSVPTDGPRDGFAGLYLSVVASGYVPADKGIEQTGEIQIALESGDCVLGQVVDSAGRPVPGARVSASTAAMPGLWPATDLVLGEIRQTGGGWTTSSSDGSFRLCGLAGASEYIVAASKEGYVADERRAGVRAVRGESSRVTLVLDPVVRVVVHVVDDQSGETIPLGGYWTKFEGVERAVTASPPHFVPSSDRQWAWHRNPIEMFVRDTPSAAAAANDGPIPERTVWVKAQSPGYLPVEATLTLEARSESLHVLRAHRRPGTQMCQVDLSARGSNGTPYSGRLVLAFRSTEARASEQALVVAEFLDGRLTHPLQVPQGRYAVAAQGWGQYGELWPVAVAERSVDLRSSTATVSLVLAGTKVRLTVRDSEGQRVRFGLLRAQGDGWRASVPFWDLAEASPTEDFGTDGLHELWMPPGRATLNFYTVGVPAEIGETVIDLRGAMDTVETSIHTARR